MIGIRQLDAASNAQVRLSDARSVLDQLLRIQLAEEIGLRGYIATRDPQFFGDDRPPAPEFDHLASVLANGLRSVRLAGGPEAVDDMSALHHTWEEQVALPLINDPSNPNAYLQQARGKLLTDQLSRDATQVRTALEAAGDAVQNTLRRRINATVAISAGFVALFAILALWYAIGRTNAMSRLAREKSLVDALQRTLRVSGKRLPHTQMGFAYASATREALVGGDLLDTWRVDDDRGWFLIADASGKGVEAARHAAFAQYAIRALAAEADDPADVIARFNRLFVATIEDPSIFIVVFLGAFDSRTPVLRYCSAGHGTAYVRRGTIVETLPPTGAVVGLDTQQKYATETVPLGVGDIVLLATDGLSEARDTHGELLGEDRIIAILRDSPADPQALCDLLVASAEDYSGGVQDDMAIVALRVVQSEGAVEPFDAIVASHNGG